MKKLLFSAVLLLVLQSTQAQEVFTKNRIFADAQFGLSNIGLTAGGGVHYGITPLFSVGLNFNYQTDNPKIKYYTAWVPEISVDYHFGKRTKTDWYAGASIGYCFWLSDNSHMETIKGSGCVYDITEFHYDSKNRRDVIYNTHIGVRYFVHKNIGVQAQIGVGNVFSGKVGLTFKM